MLKLSVPVIKESVVSRENDFTMVTYTPDSTDKGFDEYTAFLRESGYSEVECRDAHGHRYAAYRLGDEGVFVNLFRGVGELYTVIEKECKYFDFRDTPPSVRVTPTITQIKLEDYGMSYTVRLPDGRFIVIDGGWDFEPDADSLYRQLRREGGDRPVIAAWIFTHAHCDHFHCFMPFFDKYGDTVRIEKFLYTFPEHDDLERYPTLANQDERVGDCSALTNIPRMEERVAKTGAEVYHPHTGQVYRIGDARLEFLASIDDTVHRSSNVNATSLVFRMELAGQVILFTGDASFAEARLAEKYGDYLRADILQVPHHGFGSGAASGEIAGFELVSPETCLIPCSYYNLYNSFGLWRGGTRHLLTRVGIGEMIHGDEGRTLTLPYHPAPSAADRLRENVALGYESCGANAWMFSELTTACDDDFVFTVVNPSNVNITVWAELIFDDMSKKVESIKIEVARQTLKRVCLFGEGADGDALFFNGCSLKARGIPENCDFAVRFLSELPFVVSHKKHSPIYHSGAGFAR